MKTEQINIAVLGNDGIGKTTLLSALTAYAEKYGYGEQLDTFDIDVTSIKKDDVVVSFAKVDVEAGKTYSFYEFDTITDFYKGVISGAVRIDAVLHVYNSEFVFLPYQRDMLRFLKNVGIDTIVGCCNLSEFVDVEFLELNDIEYEGTLEDCGFEDCAAYHFAINCEYASMAFEDALSQVENLFDCIADQAHALDTTHAPSARVTNFEAAVYVLKPQEGGNVRPLVSPAAIRFSGETSTCACTFLDPNDDGMVLPGDQKKLAIKLDSPRTLRMGDFLYLECWGKTAAIARVVALD